ncbi:unnamed protein product [Hymenolepis diminuta]|uniref:Uncharacterized protein n=1 Tax=Hymenolepis diminuta TaxID=6216 RepID=A0A3P6ZX35_HYMDI|nr:unnamed protein product [Hymenolepis diminuta]
MWPAACPITHRVDQKMIMMKLSIKYPMLVLMKKINNQHLDLTPENQNLVGMIRDLKMGAVRMNQDLETKPRVKSGHQQRLLKHPPTPNKLLASYLLYLLPTPFFTDSHYLMSELHLFNHFPLLF